MAAVPLKLTPRAVCRERTISDWSAAMTSLVEPLRLRVDDTTGADGFSEVNFRWSGATGGRDDAAQSDANDVISECDVIERMCCLL